MLKDLTSNGISAYIINVVRGKADPALGVVIIIVARSGEASPKTGVDGFGVCD